MPLLSYVALEDLFGIRPPRLAPYALRFALNSSGREATVVEPHIYACPFAPAPIFPLDPEARNQKPTPSKQILPPKGVNPEFLAPPNFGSLTLV